MAGTGAIFMPIAVKRVLDKARAKARKPGTILPTSQRFRPVVKKRANVIVNPRINRPQEVRRAIMPVSRPSAPVYTAPPKIQAPRPVNLPNRPIAPRPVVYSQQTFLPSPGQDNAPPAHQSPSKNAKTVVESKTSLLPLLLIGATFLMG